jgi:hypothetical protein
MEDDIPLGVSLAGVIAYFLFTACWWDNVVL